MPKESVIPPVPFLVEPSKLVSIINLRSVTFFDMRRSLYLLHILELHLQGIYLPVHLINSFLLFILVDCASIYDFRVTLTWDV